MCKKFPLFTCINVRLLKLIFSKDVLPYFFVFARRAVRKAWKGEEAVLLFIASNLASVPCFCLVGFRLYGAVKPPLTSVRAVHRHVCGHSGIKPTNFMKVPITSPMFVHISTTAMTGNSIRSQNALNICPI